MSALVAATHGEENADGKKQSTKTREPESLEAPESRRHSDAIRK